MAKMVNISNATFINNTQRDIYLENTVSTISYTKFINS